MEDQTTDVLIEGYLLATGENIGYRIGYKRFYFVLTTDLYYYETKESFVSGSNPVGVIGLEAFSVSKRDDWGKMQFAIHAYCLLPHLQHRYPNSIEFSVDKIAIMNSWIDALTELSKKSNLPDF